MFNQSLQLREAGRGEGWDRVRTVWEWSVRLQVTQKSDVWIHDQLHSQTQTSTRNIHEELCSRKLYNSSGNTSYVKLYFVFLFHLYCKIWYSTNRWLSSEISLKIKIFIFDFRWLPTEILKKLFCVLPTCLKCPPLKPVLNTTSTNLSRNSFQVPSSHHKAQHHIWLMPSKLN